MIWLLSIIGILLGIWLVPLLYIWAFSTLFGIVIPVTFKTWLAALILGAGLLHR